MAEAGWQPDPTERHEWRYWDGSEWTEQVSDGGVVASDVLGDFVSPAAPRASQAAVGEADATTKRGSIPGAEVEARRDPLAVWALGLAIGSALLCPVIAAVAALILARRAKRHITQSGGASRGLGLVTAAQVIAIVGLVFWIPVIVIAAVRDPEQTSSTRPSADRTSRQSSTTSTRGSTTTTAATLALKFWRTWRTSHDYLDLTGRAPTGSEVTVTLTKASASDVTATATADASGAVTLHVGLPSSGTWSGSVQARSAEGATARRKITVVRNPTMPDFRGLTLKKARNRAKKLGFDASDYDAAADNDRYAVSESDWVVVVQKPAPGSPYRSKRVNFGRVKTVEVQHFTEETLHNIAALPAPQPPIPPKKLLVAAATRFCDKLYGASELEDDPFTPALARFVADLSAGDPGLTQPSLTQIATAAAGPAVSQFCSDAAHRLPPGVAPTTPPTTAPAPPAIPPPPANPSTISLAEFQALQPGMTYAQVAQIIGGEGELMSESSFGGYTTRLFAWDGDDWPANATVMFQNDRLISKAQFGLG